jgi:hypothetical protein
MSLILEILGLTSYSKEPSFYQVALKHGTGMALLFR